MRPKLIVGVFILVGVMMVAVSVYVGGGDQLTCERDREVNCSLETRRWWGQVLVDRQELYGLTQVILRHEEQRYTRSAVSGIGPTRSVSDAYWLEFIARDITLHDLGGEKDHVQANLQVLREFLDSTDPGPVVIGESDWLFSKVSGMFGTVWLLLSIGFGRAFLKHFPSKGAKRD